MRPIRFAFWLPALLLAGGLLLVANDASATPDLYQADYDRGYDQGLGVGYGVGFGRGETRGATEGAADGEQQGFDDGYDEAYGPAFTIGYDAAFPEGEAEGTGVGMIDGFADGYTWEPTWYLPVAGGVLYGDWSGNYVPVPGRHFGSSVEISTYSEGGLGFTIFSDSLWPPDLNQLYYDQGYWAGHREGVDLGETDGYEFAYGTAFDAAYEPAFDEGLIVGADEGEADGAAEGYDDGYDAGYDAGRSEGFRLGAQYRLSGRSHRSSAIGLAAASQIPEPSAALLLMLGAGVAAPRRRR